jgi:hypothetical protein
LVAPVQRATAQTSNEKPALLILFLAGGYNALFASPNSFARTGTFGVTPSNQRDLGNGLFVDAPTLGTLPDFALKHMATVGLRHSLNVHEPAQRAVFSDGNRNYGLRLAAALGGDGTIKCAQVGSNAVPGPTPAENGVSLQIITDMKSTIEALGGTTDSTQPERAPAAKALRASERMSRVLMARGPVLTRQLSEGYRAAIDTLEQPQKPFRFSDLATAYGLPATATSVNSFPSQMAAAELMISAGANVVFAADGFLWDSHGDRQGSAVRTMMAQRILPPLGTFISRVVNAPDRNVAVALVGDFARSLPGSDHASALSATVIGKLVKPGSTGRMNENVELPTGTPSAEGFWAYLATILRVPTPVFGTNPHRDVVV